MTSRLLRSAPALLLLGIAFCMAPLPALAGDGTVDSAGNITLTVNFRVPPTQALIDLVRQQFERANMILCDAADGQLRISNINVRVACATPPTASDTTTRAASRAGRPA